MRRMDTALPLHWTTRWARRIGDVLLGPGGEHDSALVLHCSVPLPQDASSRAASTAACALDWLDTIDRRYAFAAYQPERRELVKALRSGLEGVASGRRDAATWWRSLREAHPRWFEPPRTLHRFASAPTPSGQPTLAYLGAARNEGPGRTDRPLYQVLLAYPFRCEQSEALFAFVGALGQLVDS
jgi:hypothetical protein